MAGAVCSRCGQDVPAGNRFCTRCGTPAPPPPAGRGAAPAIAIAALAVVVIALAAVIIVLVARRPSPSAAPTTLEQVGPAPALALTTPAQPPTPSVTPTPTLTPTAADTQDALGGAWSVAQVLQDEQRWRAAVQQLPQLPLPTEVTVPAGQVPASAGAQAFATALAQGEFTKIRTYCWTMSPSYIDRNYVDDTMRAAVLQAMGTPTLGAQNGYYWKGPYVTVAASDAEFTSAFTCPYVTLNDGPQDVTQDDVAYAVERYVRSFSADPVSPHEDQYVKVCQNDMNEWNPLDRGHVPIALDVGTDPFGQLTPAGAAPTGLTVGERTSRDDGAVFVATGTVAFTDGRSRTMTFVLSARYGPSIPCLGQAIFGLPADLG